MRTLNVYSSYLAKAFGILAAAFVLLIMVMMVADVVIRMSLGSSMPGVYELVELSLAAAVFLGLPVTQRLGGMIRVDFVVERLRPPIRRGVDVFAISFSLIVCAVMTVATFQSYDAALQSGEARTGLLTIPTWPSRLAVAVGLAVLCVELLVALIKAIRALRDGTDQTDAPPALPLE
ncbi:TRAP transporter small permease subunit [Microbacterium pseudoresistens]|uniref:TRAP-type C4-dicarboxylate transport system permease small subunit n=1 Tax=Microbacterium pseudoresistens TaxID=640634 RepID=A0A7Y9ETE7_9MICO|nr:TRAP transporter small permease [Microbacterium pseudoresistens]NYD53610.1 TRAP-type C4-dicarboxylate transport system permease small subunit [Microbacterium pseudoresistens]